MCVRGCKGEFGPIDQGGCPHTGRRAQKFMLESPYISGTHFCGLEVLIMAEFISEDLNRIAKRKVFYIFLARRYSGMIHSPIYRCPPLLSSNINSVEICDSISSLLNSISSSLNHCLAA